MLCNRASDYRRNAAAKNLAGCDDDTNGCRNQSSGSGLRGAGGLDDAVAGDVDGGIGRVGHRGVAAPVGGLAAAPGEIVGLAGIAGAGHATVLELVSGRRRPERGTVLLPGGRPVPRGLRGAIGAGVALVSGDRRRFGLMLDKPLWDNIDQVRAVALAADGPLVSARRLRAHARDQVERLQVRTPSIDARAGALSGGNQQKVVFAKWLDAQPSVLLLDDPTRGVDVGAKAEMHALVRGAAAAGAVVLLTSTDLDELAEVCDRVLVFHRGAIAAELGGEHLRPHALLEAMNTGARQPGSHAAVDPDR